MSLRRVRVLGVVVFVTLMALAYGYGWLAVAYVVIANAAGLYEGWRRGQDARVSVGELVGRSE